MLLHTSCFYFEHIEDFELSTAAVGGFLDIIVQIIKSGLMLKNNDRFIKLYFKLRRLCDNPNNANYENAQALERRINLYVRVYFYFMGFAVIAVTTNPFFVQCIEYFQTGKVIKYRWELPFLYANPLYNLKSSPAYELTYAVFIITVVPIVIFAISSDFLFMASCIHIGGLFDDLNIKLKFAIENARNGRTLRDAVDYQNTIYDIVKDAQEVFGSIYFTQCLGALVIVCTLIFVATQVSGPTYSECAPS